MGDLIMQKMQHENGTTSISLRQLTTVPSLELAKQVFVQRKVPAFPDWFGNSVVCSLCENHRIIVKCGIVRNDRVVHKLVSEGLLFDKAFKILGYRGGYLTDLCATADAWLN